MAYEINLKCSYEKCNKEVEVPQVGAMPKGWISLGYIKTILDEKFQPKGAEPIMEHFCCWEHLVEFGKGMRGKKVESE